MSHLFTDGDRRAAMLCRPTSGSRDDGTRGGVCRPDSVDVMARRYADGNRMMHDGGVMAKRGGGQGGVGVEIDVKIDVEKERADKLIEFKLKKQAHNYLKRSPDLRKGPDNFKSLGKEALMAKSRAIDQRIEEMERFQDRGKSYRTYYGRV